MKLLVDSCVFIDAFDPDSQNHSKSLALLEALSARKVRVVMPAHGWFEVQCSLQKLTAEKRFFSPKLMERMQYELELIHIDAKFIEKYSMADIPYIKAGDHIFLAIAKVSNCALVTSDGKMRQVGKSSGIKLFSPEEALDGLFGA